MSALIAATTRDWSQALVGDCTILQGRSVVTLYERPLVPR
jgi:hypothetical protein